MYVLYNSPPLSLSLLLSFSSSLRIERTSLTPPERDVLPEPHNMSTVYRMKKTSQETDYPRLSHPTEIDPLRLAPLLLGDYAGRYQAHWT